MKLMGKAMDAYSLRQKAIASNVANVDTPGYKRLEVSFEDELQKAEQLSVARDTDFSGVQPELEETEDQPLLEDEMMTLADTQMRVQLVTRSLRHSGQLIRQAITGRSQ